MVNVIDEPLLLTYPGVEPSDSLALLVTLTNGLVTEKWANPVTPVPTSVTALALEVAARAARNPRGIASITRSVDDATRTERFSDSAARAGVYLTSAESRLLRGRRRVGTIRTRPGY